MGKFEVIKHIATGGMGAVYRAWDTEKQREVALKILQTEMAINPTMLERFRREARSAQKLNHENIVKQFEWGEVGGTHYLCMEFVDGIDLHEYVKDNGPADPEEARLLILQGARALQHAYEQSIVHRDIKPSNFLLTYRGEQPLVKLVDFGLAREIHDDDFRVTKAGTTVGTVDYMSPEQARDSGAADIRSDLYSLGGTWYHLLTGHAPFPVGGLGERLMQIMHDSPPDIRGINRHVSASCWEVMSRLLEKDPADRYQSPAELIADLMLLEGKATARPRSGLVRRPGKQHLWRRWKAKAWLMISLVEKWDRRFWYSLGGATAMALLAVLTMLIIERLQRSSSGMDEMAPPQLPGVVNGSMQSGSKYGVRD